ncbi:uncharacterized protein F5147DRAFT_679983 [Suillus discolor]|uniref:BTB domain-containing protein n=1 Tax=Suillus discolor TaxID=1912936 RepID=A0A9P7FDM5_9AGAM|nr:uncharacterized protein F5147DRAFT_679983 [Suillus discolor]KAG2113822.1 hypothetical protein F5147DRAFT_679983 [Suillus discolor]
MMETESIPDTALVKALNYGGTFHQSFSSLDADVVLGAKDQTLFRIHSWTLKTTSGWFRSLFSMPQQNPLPNHPEVINLDEDSHTLESLLLMICGLPINPLTSYDEADAMLFAAEKYDMPGPMSLIRVLIMTPPFLDQPLRLYAAATRCGWEEEARHASAQSLALNIYAQEYQPVLRKLHTGAVLDLMNLHRNRREGIRQRLNEQPFVTGSMTASCPRCRWKIDHHTWRELKYRVVMEMDVRPLGDTVVDVGLTEWPEAIACWDARCPNTECTCVLYDKVETLRLIRDCIDGLPKTT